MAASEQVVVKAEYDKTTVTEIRAQCIGPLLSKNNN